MDLQAKINEWRKTKSVSTANEICEHLSKRVISDELFRQVVEWGRERNITNPDKQLCKVLEEVGEIAHEVCRSNYTSEELQDALGDATVTLIILADILNFDLLFCLQEAYDTIKNRKGETIDGCFKKADE